MQFATLDQPGQGLSETETPQRHFVQLSFNPDNAGTVSFQLDATWFYAFLVWIILDWEWSVGNLVVALDFAARYNEKCAAFNSLIFIADSKNMIWYDLKQFLQYSKVHDWCGWIVPYCILLFILTSEVSTDLAATSSWLFHRRFMAFWLFPLAFCWHCSICSIFFVLQLFNGFLYHPISVTQSLLALRMLRGFWGNGRARWVFWWHTLLWSLPLHVLQGGGKEWKHQLKRLNEQTQIPEESWGVLPTSSNQMWMQLKATINWKFWSLLEKHAQSRNTFFCRWFRLFRRCTKSGPCWKKDANWSGSERERVPMWEHAAGIRGMVVILGLWR